MRKSNPKHFEGRFINDARFSKHKVNARFAAGYTTNMCSATGFHWVRIYATRRIRPGEGIFIGYGNDFWANLALSEPPQISSHKMATTTTPVSSRWATPAPIPDDSNAPTQSELWAAPAPYPSPSPTTTLSHQLHNDINTTSTTHSHTMIWPSSPTILGHTNPPQHTGQYTTQHIHFNTPLSPIAIGPSPNHNQYMNEIFTFSQMYDLNETLLLPQNLTNPDT